MSSIASTKMFSFSAGGLLAFIRGQYQLVGFLYGVWCGTGSILS